MREKYFESFERTIPVFFYLQFKIFFNSLRFRWECHKKENEFYQNSRNTDQKKKYNMWVHLLGNLCVSSLGVGRLCLAFVVRNRRQLTYKKHVFLLKLLCQFNITWPQSSLWYLVLKCVRWPCLSTTMADMTRNQTCKWLRSVTHALQCILSCFN